MLSRNEQEQEITAKGVEITVVVWYGWEISF